MKNPKIQVYKARDGWRWRRFASNGNITAESGEAYATRSSARRAVASVLRDMCEAHALYLTDPSYVVEVRNA